MLETPVPLLQDDWEFSELLRLFDRVQPRTILEIGSLYGGTLYHWLQRYWVEKVVSVDLPPTQTSEQHPLERIAECREQWTNWSRGRLTEIIGDSRSPHTLNAVKSVLGDTRADWLFIDGGHDYETVKSDWNLYLPLVRRGVGVVAFHDVVGVPSVARFWTRIKPGLRTIEISRMPGGLGIGAVFVE